MIKFYAHREIQQMQNSMHEGLNDYSKNAPITGRLLSVPVAVLDVGSDICKLPLGAIEFAAFVAINVIGKLFSDQCTIKDAIRCTQSSGVHLVAIPVVTILAPVKLIYQLFMGLYDPANVQSFSYIPSAV